AWILTTGLNNGVSKLVGEGISRYRLLAKHPKRVTAIGLSLWGCLSEDTRELLKHQSKMESSSRVLTFENGEMLEWNHTHFLLLDDGQLRGYLSDLQRSSFVQAAVDDRIKWECLDAAKELFERKRNRDEELKFKEKIQKPTLSQILQPTGVLPLPGLSSGSADVSVGLSFSDR
ncbi:unnamed protein product, partial [Didymodactylos carnosus]